MNPEVIRDELEIIEDERDRETIYINAKPKRDDEKDREFQGRPVTRE